MEDFNVKEACDHLLNPIARFGELLSGQTFRFPGQQVEMVRTRSGYRRVSGGRIFRTSKRAAVIPITERENDEQ